MLPAPDAERRLSKEDAKGSGNILNWQPKVSKAKKQAINAANKDAVELPAALAPSAKRAGTGMVNKMPPAVAEKLASLYETKGICTNTCLNLSMSPLSPMRALA